jgi:flagellar export protein FliJ
MAFRFPLAAVLLVREHAEKREERALKAIQIELSRVAREADELDAATAQAHDAREKELQQPTPSFRLHEYQRRIEETAEKKKTLLQQMRVLRQDLAQQMRAYQAAHRDREALTDMLQTQREAYDQQQERERQKQIDDIFMARHHRR